MPKKPKHPEGRYSARKATIELEAVMSRKGLTNKEVGEAVGIAKGQFSHKLNMDGRSEFSIEELGRIANYLDAPIGWPFITWDIAESLKPHR